jgi:hypothetical protein
MYVVNCFVEIGHLYITIESTLHHTHNIVVHIPMIALILPHVHGERAMLE